MEKSYSQEQIDLITKGVRPEDMDYEEFKTLRAEINKMLKGYLKGRVFHKSSWVEEIPGTKYIYKKTKTYIKSDDTKEDL